MHNKRIFFYEKFQDQFENIEKLKILCIWTRVIWTDADEF